MYFKIILAAVFFQSNILIAQTSGVDINNSNSQVQTNLGPDEVCVQQKQTTNAFGGINSYDPAYQQCLQRNAQRAQVRAYTNRGASDAQAVLNGLVAPVNNCVPSSNSGSNSSIGGMNQNYDYAYQSCLQGYNAQLAEYNRKKQVEALMNQQQAATTSALTAQQQEFARLNDRTATGSMKEVQNKNSQGQSMYQQAAMELAKLAAQKFMQGSACASSCPTGCCSQVGMLMAAGAAFMALNGKSNKQAGEHGASALQACQTFNQLSSAQQDCSGIKTTVLTPTLGSIYDSNGKCKPTAPPGCTDLTGTGSGVGGAKIPSNCKDPKTGLMGSCLTAGLNAFRQNADGTITIGGENGDKTYSLSDFKDRDSMIAAGMSAAAADALMNDLYGNNSALAKAGLDAKNLADGKDKKTFGVFSDIGATGAGASVLGKDGSKKFGDKLSDTALADRRPTSEGLNRDFNGDLIGSAGDDIFSMMKRRYILKNEQDTFIAP